MTITVTTDVFCEGAGCSDWVQGVTGAKADARGARAVAYEAGWQVVGKDGCEADMCPRCQDRGAEPKRKKRQPRDAEGRELVLKEGEA